MRVNASGDFLWAIENYGGWFWTDRHEIFEVYDWAFRRAEQSRAMLWLLGGK
jgi:hypothetical protein